MTVTKANLARAHAVLISLVERFPKTFVPFDGSSVPQPLAIGAHDLLHSAFPDIDLRDLRRAMSIYCTRSLYLKAAIPGAERIDLDGNVTGVVTIDEYARGKAVRAAAKAARRAKRARRVQQAPKTEPSSELRIVPSTSATTLLRTTLRPVIVEVIKCRSRVGVMR